MHYIVRISVLFLLLISIQEIHGRQNDLEYTNMLLMTWAIIATVAFAIIFILFLFLCLILTIIILRAVSEKKRSREVIMSKNIDSKEGIHLESNC